MMCFKHCCDRMQLYLEDGETAIAFDRQFREYGILVLDGGSSVIEIHYCPWCGARLPESLRDEWFKEIEGLGIDPHGDSVPLSYQSDDWWRLRPGGTLE